MCLFALTWCAPNLEYWYAIQSNELLNYSKATSDESLSILVASMDSGQQEYEHIWANWSFESGFPILAKWLSINMYMYLDNFMGYGDDSTLICKIHCKFNISCTTC